MSAWDVVDGVVRHEGNQSVRGWMGADNGGRLGNDIRLYAENFNADRFTVGISIRFFGGYTDGTDLGMLQQCMGYVVAQGFLQINMATCGACGDGAADQVVIDDFMKAVLSRAGVAQQNIQVHIEPDTLWGAIRGLYSLMYQNGTGGTNLNHDDFGQKNYDIYSDLLSGDMVLNGYNYGWYEGETMSSTLDYRDNSNYKPWRYYYRIIRAANGIIDGLGGNERNTGY